MKKINKKKAVSIFNKIVSAKTNQEDFVDYLVEDIKRRLESNQLGFAEMHPTTYLNGERWTDERTTVTSQNGNGNSPKGGLTGTVVDRLTDTSWADGLVIGENIDQLEHD